jgi:hypothetical protein
VVYFYKFSITNSLIKASLNFSKTTLSFFRKEYIKNFFFLSNEKSNNHDYMSSLVKLNLKSNYWNKFTNTTDSIKKSTSSDILYLYKPESLLGINQKYECLFLRKNTSFNNGRYSRHRQVYRTGVYMCFYINILVMYSLWFYFYKFKFKFTYYWWAFFLLPASFVHTRALKYNLYLPRELSMQMFNYINWILTLLKK